MSKPRFDDPDLSTPAHDAIMLWLDENAGRLIHELLVSDVQQRLGYEQKMTRCTTVWEQPRSIVSHSYTQYGGQSQRQVGTCYIDMLITSWARDEDSDHPSHSIMLACEVKPAIKSVGELIRQLRQYEGKHWKVAVVSPDDRFRDIIERQGFIFIKAPQPEYGPQGGLF